MNVGQVILGRPWLFDKNIHHLRSHKLHKEISDKNKWSNVKPILRADSRKIFKNFNVGDYVMVRIYLKQFQGNY